MTMIAVGQGLRGIANKGMGAVAKAEAIEEQQRLGIEASEKAAESQLLGTGAGIGGMVGAKNLAAASQVGETAAVTGDAVMQGGKLFINQSPAVPTAAELALNPSAGALASPVGTTGTALSADGLVVGGAKELAAQEGGKALAAQGLGTTTTTTGSTVAAGGTAAGGSGAMATLSSLAAPVAIGLGVAFLLNKLFD
jgi:hypothetical protein